MSGVLKWKLPLIIVVLVLSVILVYPPAEKINPGLDLQGGIHLRLKVLTDKAIETQTDQIIARLKDKFKESSIKFEKIIRPRPSRIEISGLSYEEEDRIKNILDDDFGDWTYALAGEFCTLNLRPIVEMNLRELSVSQALETIRNRVDEFGVSEPSFQSESSDRILVQLPGVNDKEKARILEIIKSTAVLEFKPVVSGFIQAENEEEARKKYTESISEDLVLLKTNPKTNPEGKGFFVLKSASVITGKDIRDTHRSQDGYGAPAVGFSLTASGAEQIRKFSAANIGKRLAIVLDDKVVSAPTIEGTLGYENQITGRFSLDEVKDLILILRSGALPAPMQTIEERLIGPSLGADSIRKGITAGFIGLFLVILFQIFYYRGAGLNSVIALLLNILLIMGAMAYFRATLTLPGIAGIFLTIGMAVDANVLIFERIKEELRAGKSPKSSIDAGFKKAFVTIFDSNLTTVIAAVFLFQFGTGPVKGFAVTLIIGLVASMFTAIFVSRVIFDLVYGPRKKLTKISI